MFYTIGRLPRLGDIALKTLSSGISAVFSDTGLMADAYV